MNATSSHPAATVTSQPRDSIWQRFRLAGVALLLLLAIPAAAHAQTIGTTPDGWKWSSNSSAVGIWGYSGAGGAVSIPGTINVSGTNLPVTSIRYGAFYYCIGLTSVTIPNSVTSIGDQAFRGCTGLTAITVDALNPAYTSVAGVLFDKAMTTILAFPGGKAGSYTIPNSVTSIGDSAFGGCTGLTSVTIPNSVTSIENSAFQGCTGLTSVTIPNTVTSIGDFAFEGCTGLTSVTIPNSVTSIGNWAFQLCTGLISALFVGNEPAMGTSVFLFVASGFTVYYYNGATGFSSPFWTPNEIDVWPAVGIPPTTYPVTPIAGANGSISPPTVQTVNRGGSAPFTATPNSGYVVDQWLVNGISKQTGGTKFTVTNVTASTTVKVTFRPPDIQTVGTWAERTVLRNIPTAIGSTVEIGTLTFTGGSGSIEAAVNASGSGWSVAKRYVIPIRYNLGNGSPPATWLKVLPTHDTGPYGVNDFDLNVNVTGATAQLRLRTTGSSGIAATARIAIKTIGLQTFTNSSTTTPGVPAPTQTVSGNAVDEVLGKAGIGVAPSGNAVVDVNGGDTRGLRLRVRTAAGPPRSPGRGARGR